VAWQELRNIRSLAYTLLRLLLHHNTAASLRYRSSNLASFYLLATWMAFCGGRLSTAVFMRRAAAFAAARARPASGVSSLPSLASNRLLLRLAHEHMSRSVAACKRLPGGGDLRRAAAWRRRRRRTAGTSPRGFFGAWRAPALVLRTRRAARISALPYRHGAFASLTHLFEATTLRLASAIKQDISARRLVVMVDASTRVFVASPS